MASEIINAVPESEWVYQTPVKSSGKNPKEQIPDELLFFEEPTLSHPYLPLEKDLSGHLDSCNVISTETASALFQGLYGTHEKIVIVDCRYPDEYEAGHIQGAININTPDELKNFFFDVKEAQENVAVVFHCEFSQKRGPTRCRWMRNYDRKVNEYPHLFYPELYVMRGGFKEFFEKFPDLCDGRYLPMTGPCSRIDRLWGK